MNEDIQKEAFGKFEDAEEPFWQNEIPQKQDKKAETESSENTKKRKKPSVVERIKKLVIGEKEEELPPVWTGQTSVLDVLAPSSVDNGSRDYIVVDGVYHSYLYVAG